MDTPERLALQQLTNNWMLRHAWPIAITILGLAASFSLYGYRIDILERKVDALQEESVSNQVLLAEIKKDIEFVRVQISKIVP